jgi:Acetyltransferase (GNAT) domain
VRCAAAEVPVEPFGHSVESFYLLPQWSALMERWTGTTAHRLEVDGEHGGRFTAVVYRTRGGVIQPRFMPYLGCQFTPTSSDHLHKVALQWLDVAGQFVVQLRKLGWRRRLTLPPEVTDVRPFTWRGTLPLPRYTYYLQPAALGDGDSWSRRIKRSIRDARQSGYAVERNHDVDAIDHNLRSTEQRQAFDYSVTKEMLQDAVDALGTDAFRVYNAYDQNHEPACSIVVLYRAGAIVQDWLAGTSAEHLKSGVTQLVRETLFADLKRLDSAGFDFCGANIPAVAAAKSEFGGTLTPFYQVEPRRPRYPVRRTVKMLRDHLMGYRRRRQATTS